MTIKLYRGDLAEGLDLGKVVAVDCETMGLDPRRDRLCLVQFAAGDGDCHIVQFANGVYDATRLKALLADAGVTKLFHFARFDLAMLRRHLDVVCAPVYCTKIASKLARTYTDRHGLKDLCRDLLGIELSKQQQTSDWGAAELSREQLAYAAADVTSLHKLRERLDELLAREGRAELAAACFGFLPYRAELDLMGWDEPDIFRH
ncbi:MAG: ribonuclease D [Alphaproteobacteria bacterium]